MTTEELVVLVAALVGAAICIGVLIGAFLFLRVRRKMDPMAARIEETGTGGSWWRFPLNYNPNACSFRVQLLAQCKVQTARIHCQSGRILTC